VKDNMLQFLYKIWI